MTTELTTIQQYYLDQPARLAEGWDVFESEWGMEIERIDAPDDGSDPLLETDLEGVRLCLLGAIDGRQTHLNALCLIDYRAEVLETLEGALAAVERGLAHDCTGSCLHPEMLETLTKLEVSNLYLSHLSEEMPPQDTAYHFRPDMQDEV